MNRPDLKVPTPCCILNPKTRLDWKEHETLNPKRPETRGVAIIIIILIAIISVLTRVIIMPIRVM